MIRYFVRILRDAGDIWANVLRMTGYFGYLEVDRVFAFHFCNVFPQNV